ncbi:MAG: type II toxin-antitoxin system Phd/YefM family antitoxin [Acidimicrobiales bacterium]
MEERDLTTVHGRQIGIRELRAQLRNTINAARSGERIVITMRGNPVASIGPIADAVAPMGLDMLSAAGLIEPPQRRDRPEAPNPHVLPADVRLDRVLDQVRGRA